MKRFLISVAALATIFCSTPVVNAFTAPSPFALEPGTYTVAARMLFDYKASASSTWVRDIDVVNVWELVVSKNRNGLSRVDFHPMSDPAASPAMVDGPFAGYRATFDFSLNELGNGFFIGTNGALSFYTPQGSLWDPDGNARNGSSERFNTFWNGKFGADGVYAIGQTCASNFYRWKAHDVVTMVTPGGYSLEAGLFWNEHIAMQEDGNPGNDLTFTIPAGAAAVPEPAALLLIGAGLAGLIGLRRKAV